MRRLSTIILLLAVLTSSTITAQRRKTTVRKKPKKEEVVEDPRITQMLASVRQVIFIDSMVVSKTDFMSHIPLSAECGSLTQQAEVGMFTNELRDRRLTAVFDAADSIFQLVESNHIGDEWTAPTPLKGFSRSSAVNPYLMPDGQTLYFAQQGDNSIGGYDLFATRYDADSGTFLKGENLGMPFSSEANDYLYVVDETNQLGYLVTDRRQPAGRVCIYVFVPDDDHRTYVPEAYTNEQIRSLARIDSISATWGDQTVRRQALARLDKARKETAAAKPLRRSAAQDASPLESLRHQASVLEKALLLARNYYARASESDRATLKGEILNSERELEQLLLQIKKEEKEQHNKMAEQQ